MAYSTSTPPKLLLGSIGNSGPAVWSYSNTDAASSVYAAGYFTNGKELGIKQGDILLYLKTDTPAAYLLVCTVDTTDALMAFGTTLLTMAA